MNVLRRISLSRLLLLGGVIVAAGVGTSALALAVSAGPVPPPQALAPAIHSALEGRRSVPGIRADVTWVDHLLEGANLASGEGSAGQLASNPLLAGATGRVWISSAGARLELQSEQGDTQIYYDERGLSIYDAASNTLYRYEPQGQEPAPEPSAHEEEVPSMARIEEELSRASARASISGAAPTDIAGQGAYTVRVSPKQGGSLLAAVELSFDATHGVPLRVAVYSTESSTPALELLATAVSYEPVEASEVEFSPPANAKVVDLSQADRGASEAGGQPRFSTRGHGLDSVGILETQAGGSQPQMPLSEGPQHVKIDGVNASELQTELGTLLSFERSGVRYLLAGAIAPSTVESLAKGL